MELLSNAGMSHDRPDFGIRAVTIEGETIAVTEEVVASDPFCNLLHFRKDRPRDEPVILVVAPLRATSRPCCAAPSKLCWRTTMSLSPIGPTRGMSRSFSGDSVSTISSIW